MGFFDWAGDRINDAVTQQTGYIAEQAGLDESGMEAATGQTSAEREERDARIRVEAWKTLGTPVALGAGAAGYAVGGAEGAQKSYNAVRNFGRAQLADAQDELEEAQGKPTDPLVYTPPTNRQSLLYQVVRTAKALIKVESNGNPDAVSPSGSYVGLLQMGATAASDVGLETNQVLLGNPQLALKAWLKYNILYSKRTRWIPLNMAILWKGGPGTLKKYLLRREQGGNEADAIAAAAPASWNLAEYVRRFKAAYTALG